MLGPVSNSRRKTEVSPARNCPASASPGPDDVDTRAMVRIFVQAQELWQDPMRIEVAARTAGEPRWLVVGRMGGRHWSAVVTYRDDRIRIISVRRARDEEIRIYEV